MRIFIVTFIFIFLGASMVIGFPLEMKLSNVSRQGQRLSYLTTHESITQIMGHSQMSLSCPRSQSVCVRPQDYSHLKPFLPVVFETCESDKKIPECDDQVLLLSFNSRHLLKIGLRL